ncbi:ABC transporter permease subunit [Pseudomonas oryzihabitans]|uniref:ABC transporter permease subunit n=1 Tax=Pseudomonas oryzihabitans TaxID=47885 RepID=UPI003F5AB204
MKSPVPSSMPDPRGPVRLDFNTPALRRRRRWRALQDRLLRGSVLVGGLAVLATITLIFFYLAYVVLPLLRGASLESQPLPQPDWLASAGAPLLLGLDEQNRIALHLADSGQATFFTLADGQPVLREQLPLPPGVSITSQAQDAPRSLIALGLSDGRVLVAHKRYVSSYPEGSRVITPELDFPYGREPLDLGAPAIALDRVAIAGTDDLLVLAGAQGKRVTALRLARPTAPLGGGAASKVRIVTALAPLNAAVKALYLDPRGQWLYVLNGRAQADVFNLHDGSLNGHYKLLDTADDEVTASAQLLGGVSLLVGSAKGGIAQWFLVRGQDGEPVLRHIRSFQLGTAPIVQIVPEQRRKGFLALDSQGWLGVFHSTAGRTLLRERIAPAAGVLALSPRADRLLLEQGGQLQGFILTNPHPEISWSALWDKVWYENYEAPARVWQSSATTTDFEPKLSLAPLTFGTLKAAFYAMLFAAPLAVAAAIYTAYFMAPRMRRTVKPVIELMEALPTVILGFFAGLFLAPFVENHLPGLFSLLLLLPLAILAAGFGWARLPLAWRERVPEGWESLLLLPVLLLTSALALSLSPWLESLLFAGDLRLWLNQELGIAYDQRNALIVGMAMGFAVIPNIFSIAEDALYSVPRSLTLGSLALGATPWQTLTRVVLLTASPGIFSALMIGLGRAVGETMIVLMATGNTPIMDANLFEGMRTLAANIAVEMPESEVGSTHYRLLFLAALVLLSFTFLMNTLAELIRQRLRKKYATL